MKEDLTMKADPQELVCCHWLLWRVYCCVGLAARKLILALVDDARFDGLLEKKTADGIDG